MQLETAFIFYASIFRLAVLFSGSLAVYLGYRLFFVSSISNSGTDATAKGANLEFTLKNAAPGSLFAAFGAFVIGLTLITGSPSLVLEDVKTFQSTSSAQTPSSQYTKVQLKGADEHVVQVFASLMEEGDVNRDVRPTVALTAYQKALSIPEITLGQAARGFNEMAWLYQQHGDADAALPLIRLAVGLDTSSPEFLHTLAIVLKERGQIVDAVTTMRQATALDSSYSNELLELEKLLP